MNTLIKCPSCQADVDPAAGAVCPHCAFQLQLNPGAPLAGPVRRLHKVNASVLICFYIDVTGSTGKFAQGVPLAVRLVLEKMSAKARDIRVYVHTGGDLDYGEPCVLICDGGTASEALVAIEGLAYQGGGDELETHADSVETVLATTPWEPDPRAWRNAFIGFLTADSKPARSGVAPAQLGAGLKSRGILTYLVAEDVPFARELVDGAGGLLFPISNNPDPVQMQQVAAGISQSLLITVGSAGTRPMTVPGPVAAPQAQA